MPVSVSPARAAAFEILLRIETTDAYASELLHASRYNRLGRSDHRLVTELVMGVLRERNTLDRSIREHLTRPLRRLDREILAALRLGAYQILFLDRVPRHAAVDQSVELAKRARKSSAAGMVNAILRKLHPGSSRAPAPCSSHPAWLVRRWRRIYGQPVAEEICAYGQLTPKTTLRITNPGLLEELRRENIRLEPGKLVSQAFTVQSGEVRHTKAFAEHRLIIQDEASQLVALLAGDGQSVLDCCAAPGGKTRILAERSPAVVALELHPRRASLLRRLVPADHVQVIAADARSLPLSKHFDRVLVDAPCSGTGTLARNPEIRWRLKEDDIRRLAIYQREILLAAMEQVASGGRLTYATCSLEPEEGPDVVARALHARPWFQLIGCRERLEQLAREGALRSDDLQSFISGPYLRIIPGLQPMDGFFAALLRRP